MHNEIKTHISISWLLLTQFLLVTWKCAIPPNTIYIFYFWMLPMYIIYLIGVVSRRKQTQSPLLSYHLKFIRFNCIKAATVVFFTASRKHIKNYLFTALLLFFSYVDAFWLIATFTNHCGVKEICFLLQTCAQGI